MSVAAAAAALPTASADPAASRLRQDSLNSLGSSSSSASSSSNTGAVLLSVADLDKRKGNNSSSNSNNTTDTTPTSGIDLEVDSAPKDGQANVIVAENGCDTAAHAKITTKFPSAKRSLNLGNGVTAVKTTPPATNGASSPNSTTDSTPPSSSVLPSPRCKHTPKGEVCEEVANLHSALACMQEKLHAKDEEISRLSRIRDDVEAELEDLTASLFEEAHKMVRDANVKQASAEKQLVEANMKVDGLETEVSALKTLVLTSTPSQPNKHLHPQLMQDSSKKKKGLKSSKNSNGSSESVASSNSLLFNGSSPITLSSACHRRLNSDSVDGAGGGSRPSPQSSASSSPNPSLGGHSVNSEGMDDQGPLRSMDPTLRKDFLHWRKRPTLSRKASAFVDRLYKEDLDPCLTFPNAELSAKVARAVGKNALCLTPVKDFSKVPRDCALMQAPVLCRYILKFLPTPEDDEDSSMTPEEQKEEFYISQLGRNRLTSVCDLLAYMRYVEQGLVKAHVNDVYWEVMRLRKSVVMARLGFGLPEHD